MARGAAAFSSLRALSPAFLLLQGLRTAGVRSLAWRAGAEGEVAPPPRTNKRRRLQPEPAPRPPPPGASSRPGGALRPPPAPPRRDESASLRCSLLPPARRAVAAVAAALGKWRPSSFSLPPFNLKRRENGASERASAGDTGRRDSSASAGCGCGGEGPLRPGAPPGGARRTAPASRQEARPPPPQSWLLAVSAPLSAEAVVPGPIPSDARQRHAALRQAELGPGSSRSEANLRRCRRHIPSALGPRAGVRGREGRAGAAEPEDESEEVCALCL